MDIHSHIPTNKRYSQHQRTLQYCKIFKYFFLCLMTTLTYVPMTTFLHVPFIRKKGGLPCIASKKYNRSKKMPLYTQIVKEILNKS